MRVTKKLFLFLILVFCFSCEEQGLFIDSCDCTLEEPVQTSLEIKLDKNYWRVASLIRIYECSLEDSVLYNSSKVYSESTAITVSINKTYTVTTTYYISGSYYIAIDSATPSVKSVKCNIPCYLVYDRVIDLRLKYTK